MAAVKSFATNAAALGLAAAMLAGCVTRDRFGNPIDLSFGSYLWSHVERHIAASHQAALDWCYANKAKMTADGDSCIWNWDTVYQNKLPCIYVFAPGIPADRLAADTRFLNSVCSGWTP